MHSATGFVSNEWRVETCSLGLQEHQIWCPMTFFCEVMP